ncbi:MAG: hypothetical protein HC902_05290 [Calothrix sp. SM1_5_4]|nr:hypothetical protein [Calothrix sp. SM1_5_4]
MANFLSHALQRLDRGDFLKAQATMFRRIVETHVGDKVRFVQELNRTNREMKVPLRLDLLGPDGRSLIGDILEGEAHQHSRLRPFVEEPIDDERASKLTLHLLPPPRGGPPGMWITFATMLLASWARRDFRCIYLSGLSR